MTAKIALVSETHFLDFSQKLCRQKITKIHFVQQFAQIFPHQLFILHIFTLSMGQQKYNNIQILRGTLKECSEQKHLVKLIYSNMLTRRNIKKHMCCNFLHKTEKHY